MLVVMLYKNNKIYLVFILGIIEIGKIIGYGIRIWYNIYISK